MTRPQDFRNRKGKRLEANFIKLGQKPNNQYTVTIPSRIAQRTKLEKGETLRFGITDDGIITISKTDSPQLIYGRTHEIR